MDFRDSIPISVGMLFFFVFIVAMMISGFFSSIKKAFFFSFSGLLSWFIGLGIAYASGDFTAWWVAGLFDPKLFAPVDITQFEIATIVKPYAMLVIQWLFVLISAIFQGFFWYFVLDAKPTKKKTKKTKNARLVLKFDRSLLARFGTMVLVPIVALPQIVQITHLTMSWTTSKTAVENNPKSSSSGFAHFIESYDAGMLSPTMNCWDDAESFLALSRMTTSDFGGVSTLEWYSSFFSNFFVNINFFDEFQSMKKMHAFTKDWMEINKTHGDELQNLLRSDSVSEIFIRTIKESITPEYIRTLRNNFPKYIQISNGLINGFSITNGFETLSEKPLGDFSLPIISPVFSTLVNALMDSLFSSEYSPDLTKRRNDCNQFINYFFNDKTKGRPIATEIKIESIIDITSQVPDLIGTGTKADPFQIKIGYFSSVDIESFYYQLIPTVSPVTASQKIEWSFELTYAGSSTNFADNHWISSPTDENYWGNIFADYDEQTVVVSPAGEVWGITSTAKVKNSTVSASHEFFWKYINN